MHTEPPDFGDPEGFPSASERLAHAEAYRDAYPVDAEHYPDTLERWEAWYSREMKCAVTGWAFGLASKFRHAAAAIRTCIALRAAIIRGDDVPGRDRLHTTLAAHKALRDVEATLGAEWEERHKGLRQALMKLWLITPATEE